MNFKPFKNIQTLIVFMLFSILASTVNAADKIPKHPNMEGMPPKPPAEAIAACDDLLVNNNCEFKGRRNELISGICIALPDRKNSSTILACRPSMEDMQPPQDEMEQQP